MSELIPPVPNTVAVAALTALVEVLYAEPIANVLVAGSAPYFSVTRGKLRMSWPEDSKAGAERLAAATALLGGTVTVKPSTWRDAEDHVLTTTWRHVPLTVTVPIEREDELVALRKQVADLQKRQAAGAYRAAHLDDQRHVVADPAAPVPSAYIAVPEVSR